MAYSIAIQFHFIDADGNDISGTPAVDGYNAQDFFDVGFADVRAMSDVMDAARAMSDAYKGPDADGIGVEWTLERIGA